MPLIFTLPVAPQVPERQFEGKLTVVHHHAIATLSPRTVKYTGGVTAVYSITGTKLEADELTLYLEDNARRGEAKGHVRLTDAAGTVFLDTFKFSWLDHTGYGEQVRIAADSLNIDAGTITTGADKWKLTDVHASGYANGFRILQAVSPDVDVIPGKSLVMHRPKFGLGPLLFGPLPDYHGSLDRRKTGVGLPVPTYRQGSGFGVSWDARLPVGDRSMFTGGYGNFQHEVPGYSLHLTTTLLKTNDLDARAEPLDVMGERFGYGYFQNATVGDPNDDYNNLRRRRQSLGFATYNNAEAPGRDESGNYTSPWDFVYERSGDWAGMAAYGQVRYQRLHRYDSQPIDRSVGWATVIPRPVKVARNVLGYLRGDAATYGHSGFSWWRGQAGLTYQPVKFLRFGGGAFWGSEFGTPDFLADKLDRGRGLVARTDLLTGPTKVSYIVKWDPRTPGFYDREYSVRQAIGILDAYVQYRRNPSQFTYGVRLRLDSLLDSLKERVPKRPANNDAD